MITNEMTVTMTKAAADAFRSALKDEGKDVCSLRLDGRGSACSGFEHILAFSEAAQPDDVVFVSEGVSIHVRGELKEMMLGVVIDFVTGPSGSGFKVTNPNVASKPKGSCGSCSCGC